MDDLEELKRKVERLRTAKEQATGALNQLLERIKEEFGCKTLLEAEAKLEEIEAERQAAYEGYTTAKEKFQRKHQKALDSLKD